jgi:hypothetical protein
LDLIRAGRYKLKKIEVNQSRPSPVQPLKAQSKPADQLTLQEILQKAAAIRDAVQCSASSENSEGSSTTTW